MLWPFFPACTRVQRVLIDWLISVDLDARNPRLAHVNGKGKSKGAARWSLLLGFSASRLLGFSASRLLCFSASRLLCFSASRLLGFSASLLLGFSASRLLCFSASRLLCFSASLLLGFSASQLLCFSLSRVSLNVLGRKIAKQSHLKPEWLVAWRSSVPHI